MSQRAASVAVQTSSKAGTIALGLTWLVGLSFVIGFALPYFRLSPEHLGPYWAKRVPLLLHIGGGMIPLLIGPFVLRMGLARRRMELHRKLGMAYMAGIGVASPAGFY